MPSSKLKNSMLVDIAGSKLTGAMPAIDGSALTGVSGFMKNASDPATDTNPSGGVGIGWVNTSDGEIFICTDATTDANVWYNVGGGDGDVAPFHGAGQISGFSAGGAPNTNRIDKYSFTSNADATDHGDISTAHSNTSGSSSTTHGYVAGGEPAAVTIEKFPFAGSNVSTTDVGDLTVLRYGTTGCSGITHGYSCGGRNPSSTDINVIEKHSFSTDGNATDVGDMTIVRMQAAGTQSTTHGHISGGNSRPGGPPATNTNRIDKFSFSTDGNATDLADLSVTRQGSGGHSSSTHGYASGGHDGTTPYVNTIDKFSFAAGSNATDVGDLTVARYLLSGTSSSTHGYSAGGYLGPNSDTIDKFPFASNANATDVGNLTIARYAPGNGSLQY